MKDIRSFFKAGGSAAPPAANAGGSSAKSEDPPAAEQNPASPPAPSPATKPKSRTATPKSAGKRAASAKAATPASAKRQKSSTKTPTKAKITTKKDKEEDVIDLVDPDFEIDLEQESSKEEEADNDSAGFVIEDEEMLNDDDDDAVKSKPSSAKKRKSSASKPKTPAALQAISHDSTALAAVEAVNKAIETLPPEEELGITLMSELAAYGGRPADEPPHRGEKQPPVGHPDCFTGKNFVISGILDSLTRGEAEDLVKRHGGKVTTAVSGKTAFLVVGQQVGRSKYNTAKEKGIKMINEQGLFKLIEAAPGPTDPRPVVPFNGVAAASQQQTQQTQTQPTQTGSAPVPSAGFYPSTAPSAPAAPSAAASQRPSAPAGGAGPSRPASDGQLWVEKWRPRSRSQLIGNPQIFSTLYQWLQDWDRVHLHGGEPRAPPGNSKKDRINEMKKKAVLLSGSPGVGKTSSALIMARELGYEPIEVNASDARGKADSSVLKGVGGKLANSIKELSTNSAVSFDAQGRRRKLVLIMDEVDGMSAGDRGGVADLIKTIQTSKIPIICICNDKWNQKLRSLRNYCLELDFRKPTVQQISKRMMEIARAEGLAVNQATMDALVQSANGGDIRLVLGQLQMIRLRSTSLSFDQVKSRGASASKDLEMSPFEAAKRLLDMEGSALSLADQIELVFQDADLVPLLVQENYLNHRPNIAAQNEAARVKVAAKAAESFSAGDVANRSVRQYQNWSLMPFAAAMGSVTPAAYMRGPREIFGLYPTEANFPRFTAWLGSYSSGNKQRRLLGELHTRMLSSGSLTADRTALRLSYLPVLRNALITPLAKEGKEAIPGVLEQMRDYSISRDDIEYIGDVCKFKTSGAWGQDPFKAVETQTKSAFTRAFNQQHVRPKTGFGMDDAKKKRKGKGRGAAGDDGGEDEFDAVLGGGEEGAGEGAAAGVKQEEEEEEMDPVMLRRKLMGMKHKGLELTLKDGSKAAASGKGSRGGGRGSRGGRGGAKAAGGRGKKK